MKRQLPWILLALSVAANLFFVGGYLYGGKVVNQLRASPQARIERLADRLELNAEQRRELERTHRELLAQAKTFNRGHNSQMQDFWQGITAAEPGRLDEKLARLGELELEHRQKVFHKIEAFTRHLDQAQRKRFLQMLARRNLFRYLDNQAARQSKTTTHQ